MRDWAIIVYTGPVLNHWLLDVTCLGFLRYASFLMMRCYYSQTSILTFISPAFIDMPELVNHARMNHARWRELDDAGVTTLADVRRAQGQARTNAIATAEE